MHSLAFWINAIAKIRFVDMPYLNIINLLFIG